MKHLNVKQQEAVKATEGRVLVLAGAGSGKTSVLTHRIAYLITKKDVAPESILGLTFTNKAAGEMRERLKGMINPAKAKEVVLSTFHSFCCRVLRREIHHLGYTSNFTIYDERDQRRLLQQVARDYLQHEGDLPSLESTHLAITQAKNQGLSPNELSGDSLTKELYERLYLSMRAYNAVDFDSLLSLVVTLFEKHPDILKKYQDHFRYLLIDEYQDTNHVQYKIASLLSKKHNNLFVVGDDDQSIYGFRGAEIKHILRFESKKVIKLEQNYRSTSTILTAANHVIHNNKERHDKKLYSNQDSGEKIQVFHAPTDEEEAKTVAERILYLHNERHYDWSDIAILYRSNNCARPFEMALMETTWKRGDSWVRGIPYAVYGGLDMASRSEIKDLIAYLKVVANPHDQEALLRIINVPRRGISNVALDNITQHCRKKKKSLFSTLEALAFSPEKNEELLAQLSKPAKKGIASLVAIFSETKEKFHHLPMRDALQWFIERIDFQKAIKEEVKGERVRLFKWENMLSTVDLIDSYETEKTSEGAEASLSDFLAHTLLDTSLSDRKKNRQNENRVSIMTFHSSKGLEFNACFLTCLEDNLLPHEKSDTPQGLEEERRLFYVALTRAKKQLTLSMARKRKRMGKETKTNPSRFLFEIPQELMHVTKYKN